MVNSIIETWDGIREIIMNEIKPFSEGITTGSEVEIFDLGTKLTDTLIGIKKNLSLAELSQIKDRLKSMSPRTPLNIIKARELLELADEAFLDPKVQQIIPKDTFRKAQAVLTGYVQIYRRSFE